MQWRGQVVSEFVSEDWALGGGFWTGGRGSRLRKDDEQSRFLAIGGLGLHISFLPSSITPQRQRSQETTRRLSDGDSGKLIIKKSKTTTSSEPEVWLSAGQSRRQHVSVVCFRLLCSGKGKEVGDGMKRGTFIDSSGLTLWVWQLEFGGAES